MLHRKLGNTGISVGKIALGTMYFGSETPEADAFAILDTFLEAGGNLVDTANVYVNGVSEEVIGRWFATRPKEVTDQVVLATKGRFNASPEVNSAGLTRRWLHRSLNASLKRLGVETIDLYQLHASDMHTPVEETLSFLDDAVKAGKIHYIGLSNFTGWQLQLIVSTAKAMGVHVPVTLQPQYSLLSREIEWEVIPAALHNGIGLLPWSPLAGGFLTGKYQRGGKATADTRAGSEKALYQSISEEYADSDRNWDIIGYRRSHCERDWPTASASRLKLDRRQTKCYCADRGGPNSRAFAQQSRRGRTDAGQGCDGSSREGQSSAARRLSLWGLWPMAAWTRITGRERCSSVSGRRLHEYSWEKNSGWCLTRSIQNQKASARETIYAVALCVFVSIASEFFSISLLSPSGEVADG